MGRYDGAVYSAKLKKPYSPEIDGFVAMLSGFVRQQTLDEGGTAEEAEMAAGMIEDMFTEMLVPGLLSGELAAGMAAEGE